MNTTQTQVRSTEEALKMALEMLKDNQHLVADNERHAYVMAYNRVIKRCEEALAQPEQEPVAWLDVEGNGIPVPVYTTPPQRTEQEQQIETLKRCLFQMQEAAKDLVKQAKSLPSTQRKPLTDEEIGAILEGVNAYGTRLYTFARAIEAAHGIKE